MPTAPATEIDRDRAPWRALVAAASGTDTASDQVSELVLTVTRVLQQIDDSPEAGAALPGVRMNAARELSCAAARLAHSSAVLQVLAAGLVDEQQVHLDDHERSTRYWLARHNGITHRAASALCRASEARGRYEQVNEAFVSGELTLGHLDAIAGIIPSRFRGSQLDQAIEAVAGIQANLIEAANENTVDDFANFCGRVRDRLDLDGSPDPSAEPSRVWLSRTFNGRWVLKGDLSADDGALLATMLMDAMARMQAQEQDEDEAKTSPPSEGATKADDGPSAKAEEATTAEPQAATPPERPCDSEWRARALSDLVFEGSGAKKPARVGLFLHIELDNLNATNGPSLAEVLTDETLPHTEAALDISTATLWGLLADADVTPVFTRTGRTLSYGRTCRLAPQMLRRIVAHRDRRCRVPGCNRPAIVNQCHHVVHWEDDGETNPCTCMGACKFHHVAHHKRGLGIVGDAEGELKVTRADGTPFDPRPGYIKRAS